MGPEGRPSRGQCSSGEFVVEVAGERPRGHPRPDRSAATASAAGRARETAAPVQPQRERVAGPRRPEARSTPASRSSGVGPRKRTVTWRPSVRTQRTGRGSPAVGIPPRDPAPPGRTPSRAPRAPRPRPARLPAGAGRRRSRDLPRPAGPSGRGRQPDSSNRARSRPGASLRAISVGPAVHVDVLVLEQLVRREECSTSIELLRRRRRPSVWTCA